MTATLVVLLMLAAQAPAQPPAAQPPAAKAPATRASPSRSFTAKCVVKTDGKPDREMPCNLTIGPAKKRTAGGAASSDSQPVDNAWLVQATPASIGQIVGGLYALSEGRLVPADEAASRSGDQRSGSLAVTDEALEGTLTKVFGEESANSRRRGQTISVSVTGQSRASKAAESRKAARERPAEKVDPTLLEPYLGEWVLAIKMRGDKDQQNWQLSIADKDGQPGAVLTTAPGRTFVITDFSALGTSVTLRWKDEVPVSLRLSMVNKRLRVGYQSNGRSMGTGTGRRP